MVWQVNSGCTIGNKGTRADNVLPLEFCCKVFLSSHKGEKALQTSTSRLEADVSANAG